MCEASSKITKLLPLTPILLVASDPALISRVTDGSVLGNQATIGCMLCGTHMNILWPISICWKLASQCGDWLWIATSLLTNSRHPSMVFSCMTGLLRRMASCYLSKPLCPRHFCLCSWSRHGLMCWTLGQSKGRRFFNQVWKSGVSYQASHEISPPIRLTRLWWVNSNNFVAEKGNSVFMIYWLVGFWCFELCVYWLVTNLFCQRWLSKS